MDCPSASWAHGKPDVRVDDGGVPDGFHGVRGKNDVVAVQMPAEIFQRQVIGGRADGEREAQPLGRPHPGAGHVVVPVSDEGDFHVLPGAGAVKLFNGQQVRQYLAGMFLVRQRVDGGNTGEGGEFLHFLLSVGADGRAVDHTAQHAGGVLDGFSPAPAGCHGRKGTWGALPAR